VKGKKTKKRERGCVKEEITKRVEGELRVKIGDGKGHSGAYSVKLLSMHLVHLVVGSSPW